MKDEDLIRLKHMLDASIEVLSLSYGYNRIDLDILWNTIQ
jgi:hypothetical protein